MFSTVWLSIRVANVHLFLGFGGPEGSMVIKFVPYVRGGCTNSGGMVVALASGRHVGRHARD